MASLVSLLSCKLLIGWVTTSSTGARTPCTGKRASPPRPRCGSAPPLGRSSASGICGIPTDRRRRPWTPLRARWQAPAAPRAPRPPRTRASGRHGTGGGRPSRSRGRRRMPTLFVQAPRSGAEILSAPGTTPTVRVAGVWEAGCAVSSVVAWVRVGSSWMPA